MSKTILITGSTDGIGKLAAIKLAKDGHEIYMHGRNAEKLENVITEVKSLSNNENIKGFVTDFSDLNAVKEMVKEVKNSLSKIDVLINNAGVFKSSTTNNADGLELRFVVNYLAPYLLTKELMPLLEKGTAPRLINLSSAAQAVVSLDALSGDLAKKLKNISVIAVNPGSLLNTNMVREAYGKYWSSADKGGNIIYDLAVSKEYEGVTGKYFDNDQGDPKGAFGEAHGDAYDDELIRQLINHTETILS